MLVTNEQRVRIAEVLLPQLEQEFPLTTSVRGKWGLSKVFEERARALAKPHGELGVYAAHAAMDTYQGEQVAHLLSVPQYFRDWLKGQPSDRSVGYSNWGISDSGGEYGLEWRPSPLDVFLERGYGYKPTAAFNVTPEGVTLPPFVGEEEDRVVPVSDWVGLYLENIQANSHEDKSRGFRLLPSEALSFLDDVEANSIFAEIMYQDVGEVVEHYVYELKELVDKGVRVDPARFLVARDALPNPFQCGCRELTDEDWAWWRAREMLGEMYQQFASKQEN